MNLVRLILILGVVALAVLGFSRHQASSALATEDQRLVLAQRNADEASRQISALEERQKNVHVHEPGTSTHYETQKNVLLNKKAVAEKQLAEAARTHASVVATKSSPPQNLMQILVSMCILIAGLWMILAGRYEPKDKQWAMGAVGTVVGFWLKQ
jgi:hypothetical protein